VTKAVAATALHMQVYRGLVDYDAPVAKYWPEYGAHGKQGTTVRDVLTHRACIPQMPAGVTPERMCDWQWMVDAIADLTPVAQPGTKTLYLSMTFGWLVGEIVRRTDPKQRSFGTFVREELALPLNAPDLWIGVPDSVLPRIARLKNDSPEVPTEFLPPLFIASMPTNVGLVPEVFERPDVRRAEVAGVGGIFSARSEARFWAMIAQGGELDGVRFVSKEHVESFATPRANAAELDQVMFNIVIPLGQGGFWLGGNHTPVACPGHSRAICHPGAGNSIGWADLQTGLAVAICHNRMFDPRSVETDPLLPIAKALKGALQLPV
jgi:CubicO group peptidase (beta-lactamase class C family)